MYRAQQNAGITTLTSGDTLSPESDLGKDSRMRLSPVSGVCDFFPRVDKTTPSTRRPQRESSISRYEPNRHRAHDTVTVFDSIKRRDDGPKRNPWLAKTEKQAALDEMQLYSTTP